MKQLKILILVSGLLLSSLSFASGHKRLHRKENRGSCFSKNCFNLTMLTLTGTVALIGEHFYRGLSGHKLNTCPFSGGQNFNVSLGDGLSGHVSAFGSNEESAKAYCKAFPFSDDECDQFLLDLMTPSSLAISGYPRDLDIASLLQILHGWKSGVTRTDGSFNPEKWQELGDKVFGANRPEAFLEKKEFLRLVLESNKDEAGEGTSLLFKILHWLSITKSMNEGEFSAFFEFFKETKEVGGPYVITRKAFDGFLQFAESSFREMLRAMDPLTPSLHGRRKVLDGSFELREEEGVFVFVPSVEVLVLNPEGKKVSAPIGSPLGVKSFYKKGIPQGCSHGEDCSVVASLEVGYGDVVQIREVSSFSPPLQGKNPLADEAMARRAASYPEKEQGTCGADL